MLWPNPAKHPALEMADEMLPLGCLIGQRQDRYAIVQAMQRNRRHNDGRLLGQPVLDRLQTGIARRIAEAMPVGMDYNVDEIRIVERLCAQGKVGVAESPAR